MNLEIQILTSDKIILFYCFFLLYSNYYFDIRHVILRS